MLHMWLGLTYIFFHQEASTSKVNLDEEDPVRLGEVLEYIYTKSKQDSR